MLRITSRTRPVASVRVLAGCLRRLTICSSWIFLNTASSDGVALGTDHFDGVT
jgi:hypothetical protein